MSYATLEALRASLGEKPLSATYTAKMLHDLPPLTAVVRNDFICQRCAGKRVLDFGASGPLHRALAQVAASYLGFDRAPAAAVIGFDFDDVAVPLPPAARPDVIVCGELLEHLGNPLHFLEQLRDQYPGVPLIVSVPNAFAQAQAHWLRHGKENVNQDHVCWYSPVTLRNLLARAGYTVTDWHSYNGSGPTAEGFVVVTA